MNRKKIKWVIVILWCGFIFYQSSKQGVQSAEESTAVLKVINSFFKGIFGSNFHFFTDKLIRKSGHFLEYTMLGLLLFTTLIDGKYYLRKVCAFTILIGFFYAVSDEIHQYFVPGRTARLFDIAIDTAGIVAGLSIGCCIVILRKKKLHKKHGNH